MLEFYFRFRFLRMRHHRHVGLHLLPSATIRDRVMTSYTLSKMAATVSQFYFQFRFSWVAYLRRSKYTCIPNFGEISQFTAEILLLPVFENKRPHVGILLPVSIFTGVRHHRYAILCLLTNFYPNRTIRDRVMTSYPRWRPSAIWNYLEVTRDHPQSANEGLWSVLKFRLDRIYSCGDIVIFVLWGFGLKLPIYVVVSAAHAQNEGLIYLRCRNWPHILICRESIFLFIIQLPKA